MSYMKKGMLLAMGGLAGLFLAALLEAEKEKEDEQDAVLDDDKEAEETPEADKRPSLDGIVESVKADAEAAMAACETDEEREAVYGKVAETVKELQTLLATKGEEIVEALRAKAAAQAEASGDEGGEIEIEAAEEKKREAEVHVDNLRETAKEVAAALDEVLASLKA